MNCALLFVMNLTAFFGCFQIMRLPVRFVLKAVLAFLIAFVHLSLTIILAWSLHNLRGYLVGGVVVTLWGFLGVAAGGRRSKAQ